MQLSAQELQLFKKPIGTLLRNDQITLKTLAPYLKSIMIISVGDATTDKLLELGVVPAIQIVDGRERRVERDLPLENYAKAIKCSNPAGTISMDSINAFKEALISEKPVRIIVDGEEDLLGAVVLALAPNDTVMFYGQPLEGLVVVRVNNESRSKLREVINKIKLLLN
ncbi:MAG: GTP-dependent dephospho-CoA kinase family protein [Nitrososphaerales archaeon]